MSAARDTKWIKKSTPPSPSVNPDIDIKFTPANLARNQQPPSAAELATSAAMPRLAEMVNLTTDGTPVKLEANPFADHIKNIKTEKEKFHYLKEYKVGGLKLEEDLKKVLPSDKRDFYFRELEQKNPEVAKKLKHAIFHKTEPKELCKNLQDITQHLNTLLTKLEKQDEKDIDKLIETAKAQLTTCKKIPFAWPLDEVFNSEEIKTLCFTYTDKYGIHLYSSGQGITKWIRDHGTHPETRAPLAKEDLRIVTDTDHLQQAIKNEIGSFLDTLDNKLDALKKLLKKRRQKTKSLLDSNAPKMAAEKKVTEAKSFDISSLKEAAKAGVANAQYKLAACYKYGTGVAKDPKEAVKWLRKAAEQKNSDAQYNLGICYHEGTGVAKNLKEAAHWYRKAADQNNTYGQYNLGVCYEYGNGVAKNPKEAVQWYRRAAEQNDPDSQYNLGVCYNEGTGVANDSKEAAKWFHKAAAQNDPRAQNYLGNFYCDGTGVNKNPKEGVEWYRKAAEQNHPTAQYNLGNCYYQGESVAQNFEEAVNWYSKAAERNNPDAQFCLGVCYWNGTGVTKNVKESERWLRKAAAQNNLNAQLMLSAITSNPNALFTPALNPSPAAAPAASASKSAIASSSPSAVIAKTSESLYSLGSRYYHGYDVNKDFKKAAEYFEQAAQQNHANAQHYLGNCYYRGNGVKKDFKKAAEWYEKAALQNHPTAQFHLGFYYENGLGGVVKNVKTATEWYKKAKTQGFAVEEEREKLLMQFSSSSITSNPNTLFTPMPQPPASASASAAASATIPGNLPASSVGTDTKHTPANLARNQQQLPAAELAATAITSLTEMVKLPPDETPVKPEAAAGNAEAEFKLGCYYCGTGVEKDLKEAVDWYQKAANKGHSEAEYSLGACYFDGVGIGKNPEKAVEWYGKAAVKGNSKAQYNLAFCYETGIGVKQNPREAVEWYRKAASQDDPKAQYNLGVCYANGTGVNEDPGQAVYWYRKAADQNHPMAQHNLGVCYDNGTGVNKDPKKAVEWYRKAADQGHSRAQFNLGISYQEGEGVNKDPKEAAKWFHLAAKQGHADAALALTFCHYQGASVDGMNPEKAANYFLEAISQGNPHLQVDFGDLCDENGVSIEEDTKAAAQGFATKEALRKSFMQLPKEELKKLLLTQFSSASITSTPNTLCVPIALQLPSSAAASSLIPGNPPASSVGTGTDTKRTPANPVRNQQQPSAAELKKAAERYREAAEQGHSNAQFNLAGCYYHGNGVEKDFKKTAQWFRKAAEQGHSRAQYNLGVCYEKEIGVEIDLKEAANWLRKAADQNHPGAQTMLGNAYLYGRGVLKDEKAAVGWYQKAVQQNDRTAQFNLGFCYEKGLGIEKDMKIATDWYEKAKAQGFAVEKEREKLLMQFSSSSIPSNPNTLFTPAQPPAAASAAASPPKPGKNPSTH